MDTDDEHFLIIRSIEDADPAAFRQTARRAPEKIMVQFLRTGMLETEYLTSLGIDPDITCRMAPSFPAESIP